jgi:DNA-3-methyladenine glycosylase
VTEYRPLRRAFFERDALEVAPALLGALLVSETGGARCVGRIVETEAYPGPHDPASHAARRIGRTARNAPMFGPPGTAYFHLNYGIHWCLNAVVEAERYPAAVLLRALEPVEGVSWMVERRERTDVRDLCSGPAKLTQALAIGADLQGHRLDRSPLYLAAGDPVSARHVVHTTRVGITRAAERKWRFYDGRSECVSRR